jgi:hypothetical protein
LLVQLELIEQFLVQLKPLALSEQLALLIVLDVEELIAIGLEELIAYWKIMV